MISRKTFQSDISEAQIPHNSQISPILEIVKVKFTLTDHKP